jgi:hypothetical protein
MWQFLRSPRRVLACVLFAFCLCLCYMIPYAYWDRPRVEIESVGQDWMDLCLSARVTVQGESYIYQTWTCANRKDGRNRDCDELSAKLNSDDFLQRYRNAAIRRSGRLSELFQSSDGNPLAFRCKSPKYVSQSQSPTVPLQDFNGMVVCGIFSRRFSVSRATYRWSGWLQSYLPFIPDKVELQKRADRLNQDAIAVLDGQLRLLHPDLQWSVHPDWSWSEN